MTPDKQLPRIIGDPLFSQKPLSEALPDGYQPAYGYQRTYGYQPRYASSYRQPGYSSYGYRRYSYPRYRYSAYRHHHVRHHNRTFAYGHAHQHS